MQKLNVFTQNKKMRKSSSNKVAVYNFGIPAFQSATGQRTCPNAGVCAIGCYARQGAYLWPKVKAAYERRLELTLQSDFIATVQTELIKLTKKHKQLFIRVHDSGDLYSKKYTLDWYSIASEFPQIQFYAYTKQVEMIKEIKALQPANFKIIFSYGGKQDALIDSAFDRHSMVFEKRVGPKYIDASTNDLNALTNNFRIGLVYHGAKSFKNTQWNRVSNE